jgi:hypothetical protein
MSEKIAQERLDKIPIFTIIEKNNKDPKILPFLTIKKDNNIDIPFFFNYKDAEHVLKTLNKDSYGIFILGLQKALTIFGKILAQNPNSCILPHPIIEQVEYTEYIIKTTNNNKSNYFEELFKKFLEKYDLNDLNVFNISSLDTHIHSLNCMNKHTCSELINYFTDNIVDNNKVLNLFEQNCNIWKKWISYICYKLINDKYSYNPSTINVAYIIKYTPEFEGNDFHNDNSTLTLRIYLNTDFSGGGIEFRDQGVFYKPKRYGDALIYPGKLTHRNRQVKIKKGNSYVLTAFIE